MRKAVLAIGATLVLSAGLLLVVLLDENAAEERKREEDPHYDAPTPKMEPARDSADVQKAAKTVDPSGVSTESRKRQDPARKSPREVAEPARLEGCRAKYKTRDFVEAAECFLAYLKEYPDETLLHLETSNVLSKAGETAESDFHLERFIEYHPEHPLADNADRFLRWADDYFSRHLEATPPSQRAPDQKELDLSTSARCRNLYQVAYAMHRTKPEVAKSVIREALGICSAEESVTLAKLNKLRAKLDASVWDQSP